LEASFFAAGAEGEFASGACGTPLRLGADESGAEGLESPGKGNFSVVLDLPEAVGVALQG
jgi:hypothetical protein